MRYHIPRIVYQIPECLSRSARGRIPVDELRRSWAIRAGKYAGAHVNTHHKPPLAGVLIAAIARQAGVDTCALTTAPALRCFILSAVPEAMGKGRRKTRPESATIPRGDSGGMKEGDRNAEVDMLAC
jgi:hypothetical protein